MKQLVEFVSISFPEAPGAPRIRARIILPQHLSRYKKSPILVEEDGEKPDTLYVPIRRRSLPPGPWEVIGGVSSVRHK